jgi:hypothetical protein
LLFFSSLGKEGWVGILCYGGEYGQNRKETSVGSEPLVRTEKTEGTSMLQ